MNEIVRVIYYTSAGGGRFMIIVLTPAQVSSPTGRIFSGERRNPSSPSSGNSKVYEYLIPAPSKAQSDAVPDAASV